MSAVYEPPVEVAFARHFAAWGLALPRPALDDHLDGVLYARGWTVRWRWREHGVLEVRATHRMNEERWFFLAADGSVKHVDTPGAFYAEDDLEGVAAYRQARRDHDDRRDATGMAPPPLQHDAVPERTAEDQGVWCADRGHPEIVELRPRIRR